MTIPLIAHGYDAEGVPLKRVLDGLWLIAKVLIGAAICIEVLSFVAITVSNFILYGHAREGSRAVYDPYTLFLQSTGPRPTAHNSVSPDPEKNKTLWMFGGSTTRGDTPYDDRTIASYLAQYLNSGTTGLHFTVKNYGMNSFNSLLETKYLQKLFIEEDKPPDLIIFYDGANDTKYFLEHRDVYGHHGFRRAKALIESYYRSWFGLLKPLNAAIYASFTKELYDKIHQLFIPLEPDTPELKKLVDAAVRRYNHVDRLAECVGAQFLLFWQPMLWTEDCEASAEVQQREKGYLRAADRLETMRRSFVLTYGMLGEELKHRPYFVSLQDSLCRRKSPVYKPDGVHLTDEGRRMVAITVGRIILKRLEK
jgi:lysophospholipase L1-like esterase